MRQPICDDYRIGLTSTTIFPLAWYGLPVPNSPGYKPYGLVKVCGNMEAKGYGFPSAVWTFPQMAQHQLNQFLAFLDNMSDASKLLYIRTYTDYGGIVVPVDFQAIMYRPVDGSGAAIMPGSAFHWNNVQVRYAHLVEI